MSMTDKELVEIAEHAEPGYWYCLRCDSWVHPQQAANDETHDREGCGEKLIAFIDMFSELLKRFKAMLPKEPTGKPGEGSFAYTKEWGKPKEPQEPVEGPYQAIQESTIDPFSWRTIGPKCHSLMTDKTTAEYWRDVCNEIASHVKNREGKPIHCEGMEQAKLPLSTKEKRCLIPGCKCLGFSERKENAKCDKCGQDLYRMPQNFCVRPNKA